jgi:bifunctional non-homologous end joining protein LigD
MPLEKSRKRKSARKPEPRGPENAAVEIAGVRLTHPNKVLYPEPGITKRDLAQYYVAVAAAMLPHLRDRPLTMVRCPSGRGCGATHGKGSSH